MSFDDIIFPEKGHIWTVGGYQANNKHFKAVPISFTIARYGYLYETESLYFFMQIFV